MADEKFSQFQDGGVPVDANQVVGLQSTTNARWSFVALYNYIVSKLGNSATKDVGTTAGTVAAGDIIPDQTGQSGNFLQTDGANTSWQPTGGGGNGPVETGNSETIISSLQSCADVDKTGPDDDNFVQDSSGVPVGWTAIPSGAPNGTSTNQAYSQLYMIATPSGGAASALKGIYKTAPSMPFNFMAKVQDWSGNSSDQNACGIFIAEAGASGKFLTIECIGNNAGPYNFDLFVRHYTNRTNADVNWFGGYATQMAFRPPMYLWLEVASTTQVKVHVSFGGLSWFQIPLSGSFAFKDPGFTIATVGLLVNAGDSTFQTEAYFDWVQFT